MLSTALPVLQRELSSLCSSVRKPVQPFSVAKGDVILGEGRTSQSRKVWSLGLWSLCLGDIHLREKQRCFSSCETSGVHKSHAGVSFVVLKELAQELHTSFGNTFHQALAKCSAPKSSKVPPGDRYKPKKRTEPTNVITDPNPQKQ